MDSIWTILMYAVILLPFLYMMWLVLDALIFKPFRNEQAKISDDIVRGIQKSQGWLSFKESVELLERGGGEYSLAFYAAQKLGELPAGDELTGRAIRALIGCLDESEPKMRLLAAVSLGKIGDTSAIPALQAATASSATADELSWYKSATFEEEFHQARARREGYSMDKTHIPDPHVQHAEVRQAAEWAIQEISKRNRL